MKKLLLLLFLGFTLVGFSQTTEIPDPNFEQALIDLGFDTAPINGSVPTANISGVTSLNVSNYNIADLTGIEDFIALINLNCFDNQLTSLDVSNSTALTELSCSNNQLTSLDVSNNTALTILSCSNNQLTSLDVSNNTALTGLSCSNNQLTSLDVSNSTALTNCIVFNNQLTSLDVSNNTALTNLYCRSNQLTSLDVSNNTALTILWCYENQLTSLDVSNNNALTELDCGDNQLTSLDVRNGNNTNFTNFYSTNNPDLICIFVDDASYSTTNWADIDPASTFVNNEAECDAITPPANDLCIDAIDIDDITLPHSGSTVLASSFDAPECEFVYPDTPGVWYVATIPNGENYMVTIDTFGSSYDTTLSILTGDCFDLVCLISNDDSSGTIQSEVVFEALSGNTYYIYVSGYEEASGEYILNAAAEQLAINDNIIEGFSYYPNPSTGTINLSAIDNIEKVTIYNLLGQKVIDKNINATSSILNIASLNTGAYLMQVTSEGKKAIYKILKN